MEPLVGFMRSFFAVYLPKGCDIVFLLPSAEEDEVVKPFRVLVETHESEESVEDLVVDFEPDVSL